MKGLVSLVGAGPGDPGLLTVKGLACLQEADCVVYDRLASPELLACTKPGCELIYVGKQAGNHTMRQEEISLLLVQKAGQYERVVRLKGGDVYVFGRGGEDAACLREHGVPFQVVPGVTSAVAGPAYAGIPVTHRGVARGFRVMTAHDRDGGLAQLDFAAMARTEDTLVFLMGLSLLEEITSRLLAAGKPPQTPAAVISSATLPGQKTAAGTLADIAEKTREACLPSPALIVVGQTVSLRDTLAFRRESPLSGLRVLLPCVGEVPSRLGNLLRERGASVTELAVCAIRELPGALTKEAVAGAEAAAFTSRNGAEYFFRQLYALGLDARALSGKLLAAVGPGTVEKLREHGLQADCVPQEHTAQGLAQLLRQKLRPGAAVLYPKVKGPALPLERELAGFAQVKAVELYENLPLPAPARAAEEEFQAVAFTSASAVRSAMASLGGLPRGARAVSIGPRTSAALAEYAIAPIQSKTSDLQGMIQILEEEFAWTSGNE